MICGKILQFLRNPSTAKLRTFTECMSIYRFPSLISILRLHLPCAETDRHFKLKLMPVHLDGPTWPGLHMQPRSTGAGILQMPVQALTSKALLSVTAIISEYEVGCHGVVRPQKAVLVSCGF